jgi:glycosyltransferase involved in cell wall biosynthesis
MRVLHVVATSKRRGAEMFASDLIGSLTGNGLSQRVAVLRGVSHPEVLYGAPTAIVGSGGPRMPGLRIDPQAVRAVRGLMATWRPDIVQAHGGEALKHAIPAARGLAPVVYRRIGASPPWIMQGVRRAAYSFLIRRAARVVAVAEAVHRETLETFRLSADRIVTIPNGVDHRRLESARGREATRRLLRIPNNAAVVLSMGALTWEKDPLAHLEIGVRLLGEIDGLVHVMVGDGPMRAAVDDAIVRQGVRDRVLSLGSRDDVPDLLAASDVVLLASRSEGMPATLIEAGMTGLPVAAYAVAGVPEVVADGITGLLAPPGDPDALANRVSRLLRDPRARDAMGRAARTRCRTLFDIELIAPQYLAVYEAVRAS